MSDTPTPEQKKQAHLSVVEAIGSALFLLLSDESFTEDESESFAGDVNEVAYLALDVFKTEIIASDTEADGSTKFTLQMTIPKEDIYDIMRNHYEDVLGYTVEGDDDEEENDE
jgi:hypothetical protein